MAARPKQASTTPLAPASATPHLGRRAALEGAGAIGALASVSGVALPSARADRPQTDGAASATPSRNTDDVRARALRAHDLEALRGDALTALQRCEGAGVRLVDAFAPRHGGLPFVVQILEGQHAGARRAFELLRGDAAGDAPLASVGALALVMENRGDGHTRTSEDDARLALRLASALAPHVAPLEALPLLTARERRRRAPFATLHVPLDPARRD